MNNNSFRLTPNGIYLAECIRAVKMGTATEEQKKALRKAGIYPHPSEEEEIKKK